VLPSIEIADVKAARQEALLGKSEKISVSAVVANPSRARSASGRSGS
jgi:hypothetical protein